MAHPRPPRAEWNARSALEPLAGQAILRDTSAFVSEANQCKNSEVPCVTCMRWIKSAGGLSVHKSKIQELKFASSRMEDHVTQWAV